MRHTFVDVIRVWNRPAVSPGRSIADTDKRRERVSDFRSAVEWRLVGYSVRDRFDDRPNDGRCPKSDAQRRLSGNTDISGCI